MWKECAAGVPNNWVREDEGGGSEGRVRNGEVGREREVGGGVNRVQVRNGGSIGGRGRNGEWAERGRTGGRKEGRRREDGYRILTN